MKKTIALLLALVMSLSPRGLRRRKRKWKRSSVALARIRTRVLRYADQRG